MWIGAVMRQDLFAGKKWNVIFGILILLSIGATITKVLIGFDIDEAYAVSMPYRILQQDRMFRDMWEVHQTSALLPAFIEAIYVACTGSVEGIVLFLRIVSTFIHLLISIMVFLVLRPYLGNGGAFVVMLVYYNFLPKWMMSTDFSMQLIWLMTLSVIGLYYAVTTDYSVWYVISSIFFACSVLAYPGMLLAYPFYLWAIVKQSPGSQDLRERIYKCVVFSAGCVLCAIVFLVYVFMYISPEDFIKSIPMVFSDGSHQFTFSAKLWLGAKRWLIAMLQAVIVLVPTALLSYVIHKIVGWKYNLELIFTVFLWLTAGVVLVANVFGIAWGPFRLQIRYLILFMFGLLFLGQDRYNEKRWEREVFWNLFIPSIGMFLGVLIVSNVGPESSASYLVVGCIATVIVYMKRIESDYFDARKIVFPKWWRRFTRLAIVMFLLSLIACKGYYVRTTQYVPSNILAARVKMDAGPLKGIWVYPEDYARMCADEETIASCTKPGDRVLFMGTESLNNLACVDAGGRFVSPTTISTPAFNEQWVSYFEQYPQYMPDAIYIAKNTIDNREKFFQENPFGKWIAAHYRVSDMQETDSLCIIIK